MTLHLRKPDNVGEQDKEVTFSHPLYYSYFSHYEISCHFQTVGPG